MEFFFAQSLSIINGVLIFFGVRAKSKLTFLIFNSLANCVGFLSMMLLGAYAATVGPIVLTLQSFVTYWYSKKCLRQPKSLLLLYLAINLIGGILTVNSPLGILPVLSCMLACIMVAVPKMNYVRILNAASAAVPLPYLFYSEAYVSGVIFLVLFLNALISIVQFDMKKGV